LSKKEKRKMDTKTNNLRRVKTGLTDHSALSHAFKVERVLQQAIFGNILLARPINNMSERVVLKAVSKVLAKNGKCRRGTSVFENHDVEKQLLKTLRDEHPHKNLLALSREEYQISDATTTYTCLPFLEGGELFAVVDMEGAQSESTARDLARGVAKGLKHLHQVVGYSHNDVSLENILLDKKGRPVLCDYGLAKRVGSKWNSKRSISGKLPYQPPEIYFGTAKKASGKGDVFSLGVTLFVLLCGIPPFDLPDMTRDQRYLYIQKGRLGELLRLWGKDLNPSVVDLLSKMLVHDPERRASIDDVLNHPWIQSPKEDIEMTFGEEMDLEMDFSSCSEEDDEEMDFADVEDQESRTPVIKSSAASKASPDSVFSFESAYRQHKLSLS
jgi:serine/threonine protein kinase